MRIRLRHVVGGLVFAAVFVSAAGWADVNWTGPGWYVEATETGLDTELVSGPYATEDACHAAQPADTQDRAYACFYEANGGGARSSR